MGAGITKRNAEERVAKNWEMEQGARKPIWEQEKELKRSKKQREIKKKGAVKIGKKE